MKYYAHDISINRIGQNPLLLRKVASAYTGFNTVCKKDNNLQDLQQKSPTPWRLTLIRDIQSSVGLSN